MTQTHIHSTQARVQRAARRVYLLKVSRAPDPSSSWKLRDESQSRGPRVKKPPQPESGEKVHKKRRSATAKWKAAARVPLSNCPSSGLFHEFLCSHTKLSLRFPGTSQTHGPTHRRAFLHLQLPWRQAAPQPINGLLLEPSNKQRWTALKCNILNTFKYFPGIFFYLTTIILRAFSYSYEGSLFHNAVDDYINYTYCMFCLIIQTVTYK